MNWKEHAHLFANGKFEFKGKIVGQLISKENGWAMKPNLSEECTLIARKIEDMTDEEVKGFPNYQHVEDIAWAKNQIEIKTSYQLTLEEFLYLTSIEVYPFDQSHFENETVIDINTL